MRNYIYAQFTKPLREQICINVEALALAHGLEIEYIRKKDFHQGNRSIFATP